MDLGVNGYAISKVSDNLTSYMNANTKTDPFKVQAAMLALAGVLEREFGDGAQVRASLQKMQRIAGTLDGVCDLHIDLQWSVRLREVPWWQRMKFAKGEFAWKEARRIRLMNAAVRDIDAIRGLAPGIWPNE